MILIYSESLEEEINVGQDSTGKGDLTIPTTAHISQNRWVFLLRARSCD
jgi:hypothetical protein